MRDDKKPERVEQRPVRIRALRNRYDKAAQKIRAHRFVGVIPRH